MDPLRYHKLAFGAGNTEKFQASKIHASTVTWVKIDQEG